MAASYPSSVKSFTALVDGVDYPQATQVNQAYDEIAALEQDQASWNRVRLGVFSEHVPAHGVDADRSKACVLKMKPHYLGSTHVAFPGPTVELAFLPVHRIVGHRSLHSFQRSKCAL